MSFIKNGNTTPLNANSGTLPNMTDALIDWFQPMEFGLVVKTVSGFEVVETVTPILSLGVWQPLTKRQLMMKPEGQRSWPWYWIHAAPGLDLPPDSIFIYLGVQYRVMARKDYKLYGYLEYEVVRDYTGAGPTVVSP